MPYLKTIVILTLLCSGAAFADVWKWVDNKGETHFVDSDKAIFTWFADGRVFYSDTPDHEDAVAVQLVWHSAGTLSDLKEAAEESTDGYAFQGETPDERAEREAAEAHYCKRVTEIYKSYKNAPRLYRTNESGDREYLSKVEAKSTMAEAKSKMDEFC